MKRGKKGGYLPLLSPSWEVPQMETIKQIIDAAATAALLSQQAADEMAEVYRMASEMLNEGGENNA